MRRVLKASALVGVGFLIGRAKSYRCPHDDCKFFYGWTGFTQGPDLSEAAWDHYKAEHLEDNQ